MSGYVVRVWCRDCRGEDFMGCFDGGSELLSDSLGPRVFATEAEAEDAGDGAVVGVPYNYEIEPASDDQARRAVERL